MSAVAIVIGPASDDLTVSLRRAGLEPVLVDGEVTVWAPPPPAASVPSPVSGDPPGPPGRLLLTIPEAAEALGVGRSTVYELIGRAELGVVHVGRSARVPAGALDEFVTGLRTTAGV